MKIHVASLGCPKNRVDTEITLGTILSRKIKILPVSNQEDAEFILINTCGFIESAVSESIDVILEIADSKRPDQRLVVMGCLVERYGQDLKKELPEVDAFFGVGEYEKVADYASTLSLSHAHIQSPPILTTASGRVLTTPPWRAYLKISEGCSNSCSYCIIPKLRGKMRQVPHKEILREARSLAAAGVKEMTLVAQDLTAYRDGSIDLKGLLHMLDAESGIPWIRLLYLHPARVDADLIKTIEALPTVCPYLDIPIQHASDRILRAMRRGYTRKHIEDLVQTIKTMLPHASLRTTIMSGFPGESEEDHLVLREFLKVYEFDHVGVFPYSDEEESPSASLPEKVDPKTIQNRVRDIMTIQKGISRKRNRRYLYTEQDVLVEGASDETDLLLSGRTRFQAQDIDGQVYITAGTTKPGDIVKVRITKSHVHDLVGEIIT